MWGPVGAPAGYSLPSCLFFLLPGPGDIFHGSDQILPHHILGSLQDFKRIAIARGNTQVGLYRAAGGREITEVMAVLPPGRVQQDWGCRI